jgi:hypothetical protein
MVAVAVAALGCVGGGSAPAGTLGYRGEVLADAPAGYWRLGETTGTLAADETESHNAGVYENGVVLGTAGSLQTDPNTAAGLDGGNDRIRLGDPASGAFDFGTGDFTAEAWVKTSVNSERAVIGKSDAARYWQITVSDDPGRAGQLRTNVYDGTVTRQVYSLHRVDDGVWHHVVVLFDRDVGISVYVDGAASGQSAGATPGDLGNAASLDVGKVPGYPEFEGGIDEVAVYRTLLAPERILAHYHAALASPPPPPPPPPSDPVLVGAGDIAGCGTTPQDEATAALLDARPYATVFTLGDNAYPNGTPEEYTSCYGPTWGRAKARTFPAVGGHDYATPGAAGYFGYFGTAAGDPARGYYSYDLGSWHVIVLNSNCNEVGGCDAGSQQERWLRADLAAHPGLCTLAYWHSPLFNSGSVHGSSPDTRPFWDALYEAGAEVVLNGDEHVYERFLPQAPDGRLDLAGGITQFTVGTGGYLLYDFAEILPNSAARIDDAAGVIELVLHAGSYEWRFLPIPGEVSTDSGSASCHGASAPAPPARQPSTQVWRPGSSLYRDAVLSDDPRAYWRLGETSGPSARDELELAHGSYLGGVELGATGPLVDDPDPAVRFDGRDDVVSMGDPSAGVLDVGARGFTVEAWIRARATDERAVVSKRPYGAGLPYWQVTVTDDGSMTGRIRVDVSDGERARQAYGPAVRVDDGRWHHVVVAVHRRRGITIFVDGVDAATPGAVRGSLSNAGELLVGKAPGYPHFRGRIDEVALYARVLDASQVELHRLAARGVRLTSSRRWRTHLPRDRR